MDASSRYSSVDMGHRTSRTIRFTSLSTRSIAPSFLALLVAVSQSSAATDASDGSWSELVIGARATHSAIYDPVRDRLLVFGGNDGALRNDVWVLTPGGMPTWTQLSPVGSPPAPTRSSSAIYDPVGDRMIVFGGLSANGYGNDVWVMTLSGTPAWTQLSFAGPLPPSRARHTAVYDSQRHRMLVFGGYSGSALRNDVWALSLDGTPTWTQLFPAGTPPAARQSHSAIYDPVRDRVVVFGGYSEAFGSMSDVWALSLSGTPTWGKLTPSGPLPAARNSQSGIYDPVRDRMLIFGGGDDNNHLFGDVWALSLAAPAWAVLSPSGPLPSARAGHSAVYDPVSDGMLVFGGNNGAFRNDVWMLSGALTAWTAVAVAPLPTARQGQSMIYDPARERVLVFGGFDGTNAFYNDVWGFALTGPPVWTALAPAGVPPAARAGHCAIYDPVRDRMIVFAGVDSTSARHDVWALQLAGTPTWSLLATNGTSPAGDGQTAIYDPIRDRMVVFGSVVSSDVWFLSLGDSPTWTTVTLPGAPPPRIDHSAVYDSTRDRMVIFGGNDGSNALDDVWALDLSGPGWAAMSPAGVPPSPRWFHSAVYDPVRDRMVVFGGYGGGQSNDTWALTFSGTPAWNPLSPSGTPPAARSSHSSIYSRLRDGMVMFGGSNGFNRNDVWALLWDSPVTGVPPRHAGSTLRVVGLRPNPAVDRMTVSFMLPTHMPARLEVFDIGGRVVLSRDLESLSTGLHELDLSGIRLPAGVYSLRLSQGDQHAVARAVVIR